MRTGLDVAIVSYRCRDLLRACLDSLLGEGRPACPLTVFVVDNASGDGSAELVEREFPAVSLVRAPTNLGFAKASNLAIRRGSAPYVLVLNPDTRVAGGTLDALLALVDERPEIGICGCRLLLDDGSFDHAARRSFPTPLSALGHLTGVGRHAGAGSRLAAYRAPTVDRGPVDAVNGAFMLIRRQALDEVGLFDEGYWMYMEDLDLCYRFAERGWTTWYEPSVAVTHVKAGTSGKLRSPRLNYHFHYGMLRFYRAHYAPRRNALVNGVVYAGILLAFAASLVRTEARRRSRDAATRRSSTASSERGTRTDASELPEIPR
jgi:GT2 family glycosyltransferase